MKLKREFDYYQRNKDDICDQYEGRYIVIVGEQILGSYASQMAAIRKTMEKHKLGEFLVHKVRRNEQPIVLPRMIIPDKDVSELDQIADKYNDRIFVGLDDPKLEEWHKEVLKLEHQKPTERSSILDYFKQVSND